MRAHGQLRAHGRLGGLAHRLGLGALVRDRPRGRLRPSRPRRVAALSHTTQACGGEGLCQRPRGPTWPRGIPHRRRRHGRRPARQRDRPLPLPEGGVRRARGSVVRALQWRRRGRRLIPSASTASRRPALLMSDVAEFKRGGRPRRSADHPWRAASRLPPAASTGRVSRRRSRRRSAGPRPWRPPRATRPSGPGRR